MSDDVIQQLYDHFLRNVSPHFYSIALMSHSAGRMAMEGHPNPLNKFGSKVYSQNDEDGITFEILRRLGRSGGVFAEFGVGTGIENNTLALAAAGWSGFWVGGEDLAYDFNPRKAQRLKFHYRKDWITRANLAGFYRTGLAAIGESACDLISIDLDGNDFFFAEELLSHGAAPAVFIVEYNAKFAPPINFKIDYDEKHRWVDDDYFGASLIAFVELFEKYGYFLVCCNITGCNAFFVRKEYARRFKDVPREVELLYAPPRYFLVPYHFGGHKLSLKTIEIIVSRLNVPD